MNNETQPLRGKKLLQTAVNQILAHPETWRQATWHCGTQHCIGGWCQILSGKPQSDAVISDGIEVLNIASTDAQWLFAGSRTLAEIYGFAENFDDAGFDGAGFDRAGFDRAGFDRDGFDHDGRDRAGFDRAGFDRAGFDHADFDHDGKPLLPFIIQR